MDKCATEIFDGNNIKFEPDLGTIDKGNEYQAKCVAFIALKTLQTGNIYWLSSNMDKMSPLDDIIMCTKHKDLNILYLFQIKYKLNSIKTIQDNEFTKKNTKLSISSFYQKFTTNIKEGIMCKIPDTFKPIHEFRIVIFTNNQVQENILQKVADGSFNTSGGKCFNFLQKRFLGKTDDFYKFLETVTIYANQQNVIKMLEEILNCAQAIEKFKATRNIANTYLGYIQNWIQIQEKKFGLDHVLVKRLLVFSILQSFSLPLNTKTSKTVKSVNLLWRCIKNQCLSVSHEFLEYVNVKIIEDINKFNCEDESNFIFFGRILFKDFVFENCTIEQKYLILCFSGKMPLILNTENREYLESLSNFKYILLETNSYTKNLHEIDTDALSELKAHKISLHCKRNIPLGKIIDNSFKILKDLSVSDVLKLLGNCNNNTSFKENDIIIERSTNKIILSHNVLKMAGNDLFVIINYKLIGIERFISLFKLNKEDICSPNTYHDKCRYVLLNETDDFDKFRNLKMRNVHFITIASIYEDNNVIWEIEWKGTYGNVENIKAFRKSSSSSIKIEAINDYFKQPFIIVSGVPGMGKTICVQQIAFNTPPNEYVLIINLIEEERYFKQLDLSKTTVDDFLNQFCKETDPVLLQIFKMKIKSKKIKILFDGFDEIAPTFTTIVSEVITRIRSENYKIILTTRTVLQENVENIFGTFSIVLQPFSEANQKYYLQQYFKKIFGDQNEIYASMVLKLIKSNQIGDSEICSIPLNLKIIAEVLVKELQKYKRPPSNLYINKLQLYERYTNDKIAIYSDKIKVLNIDKEDIERYHKFFAVKTMFKHLEEYVLIKDELNAVLNYYISKIKRGSEKTGFLSSDVKQVFIHKTIGEYFGAKWIWDVITSNIDECITKGEIDVAKVILKNYLLRKEFDTLRSFFDLMASKDCPLHKAILAEDYKYIIDNYGNYEINVLDKLNRTILHTLISNCQVSNKTNQLNSDLMQILIVLFQDCCQNIITYKDISGLTPFDYANARMEKTTLQIFVNQICIEGQCQFYVYYNKMYNIIEFLFPDQSNIEIPMLLDLLPNIQNTLCTGLHDAAKFGHLNVIEAFLNGGTDINIRDEDGNHIIHNAAQNGHLDIVDFLLCNGVASVTENNAGATALHCAASNANPKLIKYLLAKNFYIDKLDSDGQSPIFYSVRHNSLKSLKFLLSQNADLQKKDGNCNSASCC